MIYANRPFIDLSDLMAALRPGAGRAAFESAVAARVGARYALVFAYGHAGAIAVFRALGLSGVDVVLPAFTCVVMADAVVVAGNRPVFADIGLADYNMRLDALKAALTPQTRAVIPTHMYGYPTDVQAVRETVGDERVLIIEDRALGMLSSAPGTAGLSGDVGLFSFGPAKHLFTIEGGVIATNSAELYEKMRAYRDQAMVALPTTLWLRRWIRLFLSYFPFGKMISPYRFRERLRGRTPGSADIATGASNASDTSMVAAASDTSMVAADYDTAFSGFQSRIGLSQLAKLDTILARRRELAKFYTRELQSLPGLTPAPVLSGANFSHYTVRVARRDEIGFSRQMLSRGIEVGQMYDRVLPYRSRFRSFARDGYPVTERATQEVVNLPIHPRVNMAQAAYIVKSVREVLNRSG